MRSGRGEPPGRLQLQPRIADGVDLRSAWLAEVDGVVDPEDERGLRAPRLHRGAHRSPEIEAEEADRAPALPDVDGRLAPVCPAILVDEKRVLDARDRHRRRVATGVEDGARPGFAQIWIEQHGGDFAHPGEPPELFFELVEVFVIFGLHCGRDFSVPSRKGQGLASLARGG